MGTATPSGFPETSPSRVQGGQVLGPSPPPSGPGGQPCPLDTRKPACPHQHEAPPPERQPHRSMPAAPTATLWSPAPWSPSHPRSPPTPAPSGPSSQQRGSSVLPCPPSFPQLALPLLQPWPSDGLRVPRAHQVPLTPGPLHGPHTPQAPPLQSAWKILPCEARPIQSQLPSLSHTCPLSRPPAHCNPLPGLLEPSNEDSKLCVGAVSLPANCELCCLWAAGLPTPAPGDFEGRKSSRPGGGEAAQCFTLRATRRCAPSQPPETPLDASPPCLPRVTMLLRHCLSICWPRPLKRNPLGFTGVELNLQMSESTADP
ncbi:vegetative cell wall protein gp1-like [Heterocephalus glaber]|uniref:Vegetative cell wall protein gp1-like n=1 Tax=Heterocephalus glaber TaxID=10181 RepID=A0AAX6T1J1_HETGA|nr:vegetative cell wall protein gp1-like [Heterocephalus glaber]